ncbi:MULTISPECIES: hypothetical protein [Brevibacterium]|uniref:hypothetical protein n=1 Tax=Brevibacterium TaxID=1696 RepID=UPI0012FDE861|nr:hypothetical protein [Brevibacterium sandarakinum]
MANEQNRTQSGHGRTASEHEAAPPRNGEFEAVTYPSQTLPLITEELAATHVTTPVMPPNPIRRDTVPEPEVQAEGTANHYQPTAVSAAMPVDGEPGERGEENGKAEKKSENRVSATQLLAGAAAAATSSVIGGQLGVAGTVVGAGVASIITGLAVTLYTSSLDKGKEKIREVGTKLAPAVKAKSLGATTQRSTAGGEIQEPGTFGHLSSKSAPGKAADRTKTDSEVKKTWWQRLRRKRVLYPVTIGVATFGIGLGAVVMAESFTDADISPGTSQISRSVSGSSGTGDETDTSQDGGANPGSGAERAGTQPDQNSNPGSGNDGSTTSQGQSTSASEGSSTTSSTADQTGSDQGTDASSSTATGDESTGGGSDSSSSSSAGTDTSDGAASSSGAGASSGSQDGAGSSGAGSSSSGGTGGGSSSEGSGSGSGSAGGGSGAAVEG